LATIAACTPKDLEKLIAAVPLDDRKQNMRVLVHALQVRPVVHPRALLMQYCHRTHRK
jgi:hypothetical protein